MIVSDLEKESTDTLGNAHIKQALEYSRRLIILADEGEANCGDDGCAVLFGVVRDCAYKIRAEAEREKKAHISQGKWEAGEGG